MAPRGTLTRPTPDRVREALFSILGDVSEAKVLDLYAGTGAFGIEALSRGARFATFVENGKPALEALRENVKTLGLTEASAILAVRVEQLPKRLSPSPEARFDIVFADPPYEMVQDGRAARAISNVVDAALLAEDAQLVMEHGAKDRAPAIRGLRLESTRSYGDTAISFYTAG